MRGIENGRWRSHARTHGRRKRALGGIGVMGDPQLAGQQPSFTDGVMRAVANRGMTPPPPAGMTERAIQVGGAVGMLNAKMVTPTGMTGPLPVIVSFHGGGWVLADSEVYAPSARALAKEALAIVVSVNYGRAPEAKFPAQHDDALAAYRWVAPNAASLGGDPSRLALAGESAGGNLAIATAIATRAAGVTRPLHVLSTYPIAGTDLATESYRENANARPLNRAPMAWFFHHTLQPGEDHGPASEPASSGFVRTAAGHDRGGADRSAQDGGGDAHRSSASGRRAGHSSRRAGGNARILRCQPPHPSCHRSTEMAGGRLRDALRRR